MWFAKKNKEKIVVDFSGAFKRACSDLWLKKRQYAFIMLIYSAIVTGLAIFPVIVYPEGFVAFHSFDPIFSLFNILDSKVSIQDTINNNKKFHDFWISVGFVHVILFLNFILTLVKCRVENSKVLLRQIIIPQAGCLRAFKRLLCLIVKACFPAVILFCVFGKGDFSSITSSDLTKINDNSQLPNLEGKEALFFVIFPVYFYWLLICVLRYMPSIFSSGLKPNDLSMRNSWHYFKGNFIYSILALVGIFFIFRLFPKSLVESLCKLLFSNVGSEFWLTWPVVLVVYFIGQFIIQLFYVALCLYFSELIISQQFEVKPEPINKKISSSNALVT